MENTPPPREGGISANVIWGEKYEKAEQENMKEKGEKTEDNRDI
jgi:hypothetical protein